MNNVRVLWGLIGGLILLLAVVSWSWYKGTGHVQTMAVVGRQTISESDWVQALKRKYGQQVLNDMVNRQVVLQEAKRLGITVDEKRIQEELAKLEDSYEGSQDFDQTLKQEAGTSKQEVMDEIRYHMLLEEIAIKDIAVDDADVHNYYESHQDEFHQPAQAHLSIITVSSKEEAEQVRQELKQGANFATLAKERSIDSYTAGTGGDMGWVSLIDESVPASIRQEVPALGIGQDSKPIPVDEGYAIIRVQELKKAAQFSFDEVKDQIKRQLALSQVSLDDVLAKLKQAVGVTIQSENTN